MMGRRTVTATRSSMGTAAGSGSTGKVKENQRTGNGGRSEHGNAG